MVSSGGRSNSRGIFPEGKALVFVCFGVLYTTSFVTIAASQRGTQRPHNGATRTASKETDSREMADEKEETKENW